MASTDSTNPTDGPAPSPVRGNAISGTGPGASGMTAAAGDAGRSLIVDEAFFEEQFLRCQVCHERFDQGERAPKSLPCNHTFCLPCLTQIFDHAQPPNRRTLLWADETLDGELKCPTCRVEIFLGRNKIKDLPNDHRVVQMMDFLSQAVSKSQNVCVKHERQPLNFFCKKCLVPVCRDCTVLDHKDSDGHNIIDVSEALSDNSTQFSQIENKSRDTLEKMKSRSDALANASKRLDILQRRLKNEIKETFIEYRLLLEKRQEALTSMVQTIIKDQKALINARFVDVCEHGTQLQKLYDEFKTSRSNNDIRKLFTITQQMKDHDTHFTEVASQDDNELFQSCEFEAQNEGSFLSDMSGLGEVRGKVDQELKEPVSAHQLVYLDMEEQRERQRLMESQLGNYEECEDDFMARSQTDDHLPTTYDSDEFAEQDDQRGHIPVYQERVSRLISRYMREMDGAHEAMEHDDASSIGNRRGYQNRRGRRSRDTNSAQVSTSLQSQDDLLRAARAAVTGSGSGSSGSASPSSYMRPSMRNRTSATGGYRVVRHQASNNRTPSNFPSDDGN